MMRIVLLALFLYSSLLRCSMQETTSTDGTSSSSTVVSSEHSHPSTNSPFNSTESPDTEEDIATTPVVATRAKVDENLYFNPPRKSGYAFMYPSEVTLASPDAIDDDESSYSGQSSSRNHSYTHTHRIQGNVDDANENDGDSTGHTLYSPSPSSSPPSHSSSSSSHLKHRLPPLLATPTMSTSFSTGLSSPHSTSKSLSTIDQHENGNTRANTLGGNIFSTTDSIFTTETPMTTLPKPPTMSTPHDDSATVSFTLPLPTASTSTPVASLAASSHPSSPSAAAAASSSSFSPSPPFHQTAEASFLYPPSQTMLPSPSSHSFIPMVYNSHRPVQSNSPSHQRQSVKQATPSKRVKNNLIIPHTAPANEERGLDTAHSLTQFYATASPLNSITGDTEAQSDDALSPNNIGQFIPMPFSPPKLPLQNQFADYNSTVDPMEWSALLLNYSQVISANENFNNTPTTAAGFADIANAIRNSYITTRPRASAKRKRTKIKNSPHLFNASDVSAMFNLPVKGIASTTSTSTTTTTTTTTTARPKKVTPKPPSSFFDPTVGISHFEDEFADHSSENMENMNHGDEENESFDERPGLQLEDSTITISNANDDADAEEPEKSFDRTPGDNSDETSSDGEETMTGSHHRTISTKSRTKVSNGGEGYVRRPYSEPASSSVDYYPPSHQTNPTSSQVNDEENEDSAGNQFASSSSSPSLLLSASAPSSSPSSASSSYPSTAPSSHYGHLFDRRYLQRYHPHRYFLPSSHSPLSTASSNSRPYYTSNVVGYPSYPYSPSSYYSNRHYFDSSDSTSASNIHRQGGSTSSPSSSASSSSSNAWSSGLTGFLLGIIPLSLIVASMVPAFVSVPVATGAAAFAGKRRRRRQVTIADRVNVTSSEQFNRTPATQDTMGEKKNTNEWSSAGNVHDEAPIARSDLYTYKTVHPVIELLVEYGMNSLDDPKCLQELFCQVVADGKKSRSNVAQKMFYSIASFLSGSVAKALGVSKLIKAVREDKCRESFKCGKRRHSTEKVHFNIY